jgi:integrase
VWIPRPPPRRLPERFALPFSRRPRLPTIRMCDRGRRLHGLIGQAAGRWTGGGAGGSSAERAVYGARPNAPRAVRRANGCVDDRAIGDRAGRDGEDPGPTDDAFHRPSSVDDGALAIDPSARVRVRARRQDLDEDEPAKAMTREEQKRLLAAMPPRWLPFFSLLSETGLRISKVLGLEWKGLQVRGTAEVASATTVLPGRTTPDQDLGRPSRAADLSGGCAGRRRTGRRTRRRCLSSRLAPALASPIAT